MTILIFTGSCNKNEEDWRGEIILSSAFNFESATLSGYNFELRKFISYPSSDEILTDIIVDQFRRTDGTIQPGFSSPSNTNGFALAGSFSNVVDSRDYFDSVKFLADSITNFTPSSDTVELYQVWVLKTRLNNYVKMHIEDIWVVDDTFGKHIEVRIEYYYQPDGTPEFPR